MQRISSKQLLAYVAGTAMVGGSLFAASSALAEPGSVEIEPADVSPQTSEMVEEPATGSEPVDYDGEEYDDEHEDDEHEDDKGYEGGDDNEDGDHDEEHEDDEDHEDDEYEDDDEDGR